MPIDTYPTFILRTVNKQIKTRFSLGVLEVLGALHVLPALPNSCSSSAGHQPPKALMMMPGRWGKGIGSSTCLSEMSQRTRPPVPPLPRSRLLCPVKLY
uniref:HDC17312 n=1 Tax=Drosophila melanogaster TaxID=7227 RepID=Q6IIR4_DROME|nr:TPA_inf: HDC17312 [Drosophila melanogaster]